MLVHPTPLKIEVPNLTLRKAIQKKGGLKIGDVAHHMLRTVDAAASGAEAVIHIRTAQEAAQTESTASISVEDIYVGGVKQGLKLITPSASFALARYIERLNVAARNRLIGDSDLMMAMNPISNEKGEPRIFFIYARPIKTVTLYSPYGEPEFTLDPFSLWAFME